jgi:outer membrane lipoprotein-sorting protein
MKKLIVFAGVFLFAYLAEAQYDQKAKEYLDKVSNKYQSIDAFKASFTYSMENPAADVSDSFSGDIMVKGKDKIKLNLRDQIIYIDGTTQRNDLPYDKEVNIVEDDHE